MDDTIEWSEADVAELRALLHECTPKWWPHRVGETCTCDQCGHTWICCDYAGTLGWRTCG